MRAVPRAAALARRTRRRERRSATDGRTRAARELSAAVTTAADLVLADNGLAAGEREADLIGLVATAALVLLERPAVSLDEVMNARYEGGATRVRSWRDDWT
jgi:hypothetical protein